MPRKCRAMKLSHSANGGVPAHSISESRLFLLPASLLGQLWPAERGVAGLRVCKQLRKDLKAHCTSILLVEQELFSENKRFVSKDFDGLPEHAMVSLTLRNWATTLAGVPRLGSCCKGLFRLKLEGAHIGTDGVGVLAGVLAECKALSHLELGWNSIDARGAGVLAGVLGGFKELAHLDLRCNEIGDEGAGRLVGSLGGCTALAHLDLSNNEIGAGGATWLVEALKGFEGLAHLALAGNRI
eukprot:2342223-Rhodomonas_salina.1